MLDRLDWKIATGNMSSLQMQIRRCQRDGSMPISSTSRKILTSFVSQLDQCQMADTSHTGFSDPSL